MRKAGEDEAYQAMAKKMNELAAQQEGYLGMEHAREDIGITISYWRDLDAIRKWKDNADHQLAQQLGREKWYSWYKVRIAFIESEYQFSE